MACLTNYCIQCTDVTSNTTGDFVFDMDHWQETGEFKAISPVFLGLIDLFAWAKNTKYELKGIYLERTK